MKKFLPLFIFVIIPAMLRGDALPEGALSETYLVVGSSSSLEIVEAPKDAKMLYRTWGPESERKFSVRVYSPISSDQWKRVSFKLKAEKDGEVYISFGGENEKTKSGYPKRAAFYDNVSVNGKLLLNGDFEDGKNGWNFVNGGNYPAKSVYALPKEQAAHGKWVARANSYAAVRSAFQVKGGEVFEISFDARCALPADMDDEYPLPLEKYANMGFIDETPSDGAGGWTDEGKNKSFKKFLSKVGDTEFEGVKFRIIDPEKNSGASVLTFKSPKSPTILNSAVVDLSEKPLLGKYIYMLHTASNKANLKQNDIVGYVVVYYDDGKRSAHPVRYGISAGDCWAPEILRNGKIVYMTSKKRNRGALYMTHVTLDNNRAVSKVEFQTSGRIPWVVVAATLSDRKVITCVTVTPENNPDWVLVDMPLDLTTLRGSALDVSGFSELKESGSLGRVIVSERGTMAFEKEPDKDVRFKGFTFYPQHLILKYDNETARENIRKYAALMPVNGYNLVRIGFDYIKSDKKRDQRAAQYDTIDFLISELKKNGVYIHLPLAWYDIGLKNYNFYKRNDVKIRAIFGDPEVRAIWKETAEEQLNHYNPYTKLAWKDDPVFQVIEFYNELVICFNKFVEFEPATKEFLLKRWRTWLQKRYNDDIEKLNNAWKGQYWARNAEKYPFKSFDEIPGLTSGFDWNRFCQEATDEFMEFCEKIVRGTGYKGIIVQRNLGRSPYDAWARHKTSESIITNSYYEHPDGIYVPGADHTCNQSSSIAREADYWRTIATSKSFDRPISATEYNHAYWNKHRFEMMSLFSPYSAFQNFSSLIIHASAVEWNPRKTKHLSPFNVSDSPAIRTAELFNQCFFMRGDVKPFKHRVDMLISESFVKNSPNALSGLGGQQMRIPLIVGFSIKADAPTPEALKHVKPAKADIEILPNGTSEVITQGWFQQVLDSNDGTFRLSKFVDEMKKNGMLPADNVSDPDNGIYQTDTGQITLDSKNMVMKVVTDYSCAATVHKNRTLDVGALKLISTSVPASVGVASLDGKKIIESSRLIFAYVTEENNMDSITSVDGVLSFRSGKGPVVMRRGRVKAELKLDPSKKYSVYPIALNGERREKIDVEFKDGVMKLDIDNGKLKSGAVPMFEIVAE